MGEVTRVEISAAAAPAEAPKKEAPAGSEAPKKPEYLPEKFWKDGKADFEGLAKSYTELEKKSGSGEPKQDQTKGEQPKSAEQPNQSQPVAIPGISAENGARYFKELQEGGKLSDASYAEIEKAGYPKTVVDAYIKGLTAEKTAQDSLVKSAHDIAGGEQGYSAMIEWAKVNLTDAEIAAYDKVMNSSDGKAIELAVRGLHSKYVGVVGSEPNLIGGKTGGVTPGDVYESQAQVQADMRSKEYKTDPAFRKKVQEKIARSTNI